MANYRTLPKNAIVTHKNIVLTRANLGGSYIGWPINHLGDSQFNDVEAQLTYDTTPSNDAGKELLDTSLWLGSFRNHRPGVSQLYDFYAQGGAAIGVQALHNWLRTMDFWYAKDSVVTWVLQLFSAKDITNSLIKSNYKSTTSTAGGTGSKTFTIPTGKTITPGLAVYAYKQGDSGGLNMRGTVTSYNDATGELVANMTTNVGTSANANWRIEIGVETRYTTAHEQAIVDYLYKLFDGENTTTSISVSLGAKSFTTTKTHRLYTTNNYLRIRSITNPANFVFGNVTAYDNVTGVGTLNVTAIGGSGTFTDGQVLVASALNRILEGHPALDNVEISNEALSDSLTAGAQLTNGQNEFARVARYVNKIFKKYCPLTTVTSDTSDQGRRTLTGFLLASAASTISVEGDGGTGKQACEYLGGFGYNNYTFNNGTFALHKELCETNGYAGVVEKGSMRVIKDTILAMTKYITTSAWYGRTHPPKVMIGEHSLIGAADDINSYALQQNNWTHGASTSEKSFWDVTRYLIPAILNTHDGAGGYGRVHFYANDNAGGNATTGTISAAGVGAHTTGEVKFTLSTAPHIPFSTNLPEKRVVITAPAGGWADLGLTAGQKKAFFVRQVAGNEVYIVGSTYTTPLATNCAYSQFHTDWCPYPEIIERVYNTFFNVPLTIGEIYDQNVRDIPQAGKTKRKFAGLFIVVPDIGTNSQYAGTYYIKGTEIGSKW